MKLSSQLIALLAMCYLTALAMDQDNQSQSNNPPLTSVKAMVMKIESSGCPKVVNRLSRGKEEWTWGNSLVYTLEQESNPD